MNFDIIDNDFEKWAKLHHLSVVKLYKDMDVRSVNFVDSKGQKYQLWIDPVESKKKIIINYWDYHNKRGKVITACENFFESLEKSYNLIKNWIQESSNLEYNM